MPQVGEVETAVWDQLVASVRSRRHRDARHLKPTCLYVVANGIDDDDIDPEDIEPGLVIERIAAVLASADLPLPSRLWRPLWHLTNDGAWDFIGPSGRLGPEDFGAGRKPESLTAIGERTDRVAVARNLGTAWRSRAARATLRGLMVDMLADGDASSQAVAAILSSHVIAPPSSRMWARSPGAAQGRVNEIVVRRAVELHAMSVTEAHLASQGWVVMDMSAAESYDLLCVRGEEILLAEVKGTTGLGRKVQLTANEVALARSDANTALAIVAEIELSRLGEVVTAHGGSLRLIGSWCPSEADLSPIAYQYQVPAP